jgi:hypothetical protein
VGTAWAPHAPTLPRTLNLPARGRDRRSGGKTQDVTGLENAPA